MTLVEHKDLEQGSDEWLAARRGIITASVVGQLITSSTLKVAANDKSRALVLSLVAERITGYTEPVVVSADMQRGHDDEPLARDLYGEHWGPATETGFLVRHEPGWTLGYSPDGMVGNDGLIEVKSRRQKKHLATILADEVPIENMAQIQCGLLVSGRKWCDYISYSGGMPMWVQRVAPSLAWFEAIIAAAKAFEKSAEEMVDTYLKAVEGLPETERTPDYEQIEF